MRIVLIADAFPPLRSSGAVQLRDLSQEFVKQGHALTVLLPDSELSDNCRVEVVSSVRIVRLKTRRTKDIGYVMRTINEFLMPFLMLRRLRSTSIASEGWDGIVWYSPSIFFGPLVKHIKHSSKARAYLVLRDIFPEWAFDVGLLKKGLPYLFFKAIANYQYSVADTIGVQAPGNKAYLSKWQKKPGHVVEVLQNWHAHDPATGCSISVQETKLAGRKIFVYAGNMGVAQGMGLLLDLAEILSDQKDIGFLLVGRGSDAERLQSDACARGLDNMVFFDEIEPDEIPGLYAQCDVGLVVLDTRHATHNIPGKFISYMTYGLPVLASINHGNDLVAMIENSRVGLVSTDGNSDTLATNARTLVDVWLQDDTLQSRCRNLADSLFTPAVAVRQIVNALQQPAAATQSPREGS